MKRADLILALADRLGVPEHSAQVFLHAFFDSAKAALRTGDPLRIDGIGIWTPALHPDGTLASVAFDAAPVEEHAAVPASGPASSIDAMHFIPAEALERVRTLPSGEMIDIAEVVDEVQKIFHPERSNGDGPRPGPVTGDPEAPVAEPVSRVDADDPVLGPEAEADVDEELPEAGVEEPVLEDMPLDTLEEEHEADVHGTDEPDLEYLHAEDSFDAVEADIVEEEEEERFASDMPPAAATRPRAENDETTEQDDEDEEDDAVFYRNRDQLYNPPEERNKRPLLIVALVLTAVMIIIILSIIFGEDERPEVPGASGGQAPVGLHRDTGVPA